MRDGRDELQYNWDYQGLLTLNKDEAYPPTTSSQDDHQESKASYTNPAKRILNIVQNHTNTWSWVKDLNPSTIWSDVSKRLDISQLLSDNGLPQDITEAQFL